MISEYEKYDEGSLLRNKYSKVADISEGSYGLVSLAKDVSNDGKLVAVKFIYPLNYKKQSKQARSRPSSSPAKFRSNNDSEQKDDAKVLKSLYEEASKEIKIHRILGVHSNITTLYDHFDSCLILEYCSRGDLYEAIQRGEGPGTSQDIKDVFSQIVSALEFCHFHSVYHRDLKPENILISEDWTIKICDWGLATTSKIITNGNEFDIGSERYMAPELFDPNIHSYDASKIDLWSIGIILLTMVFRKNPFQVASNSDKVFLQFARNREALFDIFSTMSGDTFSVLRHCLTIDPENRDISKVKLELKDLKYFTIDEEYWASPDEDDEEFEDDYPEDYYLAKERNMLANSPMKYVQFSPHEVRKNPEVKVHASPNTSGSDAPSSSKDISSHYLDDVVVSHNPRADALLSSSTRLKPIPIGGQGVRFRNTRKPFNVASYHQSTQSSIKMNHGRFNREDFFTPKSVMTHYMDKYGESKNRNGNKSHTRQGSDWGKNDKRHISWKLRPKSSNQAGKKHTSSKSNNEGANSRFHATSDSGGYNHRKKSNSFSKSRLMPLTSHNLSAPHSSSVQSQYQQMGTSLPNSGKYVPPFLRSPFYSRSPDVQPLPEKIASLSLDDEDEVFHLEDDFDAPQLIHKSPHKPYHNETHFNGNSQTQTVSSGLLNDIAFRKPNYKSQLPVANSTFSVDNEEQSTKSLGHTKKTECSRSGPFSTGMNVGSDQEATAPSSVSSTGKYIPPFRRGSHPSNVPGTMITGRSSPEKSTRSQEYAKSLDNFHNAVSSSPVNNSIGMLPREINR